MHFLILNTNLQRQCDLMKTYKYLNAATFDAVPKVLMIVEMFSSALLLSLSDFFNKFLLQYH